MKAPRKRSAHFAGVIHGWPCVIRIAPGVIRLRRRYGRQWHTLNFEQAWDACNGQGHFPLQLPGPYSETPNTPPPGTDPPAATGPAQTAPPAGILQTQSQ